MAAGGAFLIEGFVLGPFWSSFNVNITLRGAGVAAFVAYLDLLWGILLIGLGAGLLRNPDPGPGLGLAVLSLSVVGLIFGGGFVVGSVLGCLGGALAVLFEPEGEARPLPPPLPEVEAVVPPTSGLGAPPRATVGELWRPCPRCHQPVDAIQLFCPYCATAV